MTHAETLNALGFTSAELTGGTLAVRSPIDGDMLANVHETDPADMDGVFAKLKRRSKYGGPCRLHAVVS